MSSGATHEYIDHIKSNVIPTLSSLSHEDSLILISYLNESKQVHSRELRGFRSRITSKQPQPRVPKAYKQVLHSSHVER